MRSSHTLKSTLIAATAFSAMMLSLSISAATSLSDFNKKLVDQTRKQLFIADQKRPASQRLYYTSNGKLSWAKLNAGVLAKLTGGSPPPATPKPTAPSSGGKSLADFDKGLVDKTRKQLFVADQKRPANQRLYYKSNGKLSWAKLNAGVLAKLTGGSPPPVNPTPPPQGSNAVKLTWQIPTKRQDGKRLHATEINHYEIYVTNSQTGVSKTVKINNPAQNSYQHSASSKGTYYFSMATVDKSGIYSKLSPIVSKKVY